MNSETDVVWRTPNYDEWHPQVTDIQPLKIRLWRRVMCRLMSVRVRKGVDFLPWYGRCARWVWERVG